MSDVVIIGGGPAGLSAALECARQGMSVELVEREAIGGQALNAGPIRDYLGWHEGSGADWVAAALNAASQAGVTVRYARARAIVRDDRWRVHTETDILTADAVILATGRSEGRLGLLGEEALRGRGISSCAMCDGYFYQGKAVAVVGGDDLAFYEALILRQWVERIWLLNPDTLPQARQFLQREVSQGGKVEVLNAHRVVGLKGTTELEGLIVQLPNGQSWDLAVAGLFVAQGLDPRTKGFESVLPLTQDGSVVVDQNLQAGSEGLYAVGEVRADAIPRLASVVADGARVAASIARAWRDHPRHGHRSQEQSG